MLSQRLAEPDWKGDVSLNISRAFYESRICDLGRGYFLPVLLGSGSSAPSRNSSNRQHHILRHFVALAHFVALVICDLHQLDESSDMDGKDSQKKAMGGCLWNWGKSNRFGVLQVCRASGRIV